MRPSAAALLLALVAAVPAAARQHTVVPGDHLWGLAGHYYKNNFRWKVIYAANREKIKDPHWIYPGQVFEIPDVPDAAIGELPARPVEAEKVVEAPPAEPAAPVAEAETEAPAPSKPERTDDLSTELPKGLAGQYPSVRRVEEAKTWKEDGQITEFDGREALAAEGDWVVGKARGVQEGAVYTVLRPSAPQSLDQDKEKSYLQIIGRVEAKKSLGKEKWRFLVVKSADSVQVGDLLKREESR